MRDHLTIARKLTSWLDSKFKIWKFKFGLDPILGLVPWIGDFIPAVLSVYILWIGWRHKLPTEKLLLMIGNVILDYVIGSIPLLGDIFDFGFKASKRNLKVLEEHLKHS